MSPNGTRTPNCSAGSPASDHVPPYAQRSIVTTAPTSGHRRALRITQRCSLGASISPLLANLFMHYAFDAWMAREFPEVPFERFVDDVIVHCVSQQQAQRLRDAIATRLAECGG
ncbi:MAG TPA: reverse transcriptase domain-containing protein, partial [Pseudonocardiaceae bacterium]